MITIDSITPQAEVHAPLEEQCADVHAVLLKLGYERTATVLVDALQVRGFPVDETLVTGLADQFPQQSANEDEAGLTDRELLLYRASTLATRLGCRDARDQINMRALRMKIEELLA